MEHFFIKFLRSLLTRNEYGAIIIADGTKTEQQERRAAHRVYRGMV